MCQGFSFSLLNTWMKPQLVMVYQVQTRILVMCSHRCNELVYEWADRLQLTINRDKGAYNGCTGLYCT